MQSVSITRVYLDQRDWIRLAQHHYGVAHDPRVAEALAVVLEASERGFASFPLSAAHYQETWKQGDPGKRRRLGAFMAQVSRFHTIASAPDLLAAEIEVEICRLVDRVPGDTPRPFGLGHAHAFGLNSPHELADRVLRRRLVAEFGEEAVFMHMESELIAGPEFTLPRDGIQLPSQEFAQRQLELERKTQVDLQQVGFSKKRAREIVINQETDGLLQRTLDFCSKSGIDILKVIENREGWEAFLMALPAKGVITRLRIAGHENPSFRWHIGDLNDMTALGAAAAYCDVVVAEKHWGAMLNRQQRHFHAKVTTQLTELPRLLVER